VELREGVRYRMAYGLAYRLLEAAEHRFPGRHASNSAAGGSTSAILAEVLRQLGVTDQADRTLVVEAVEDVVAGRNPQW
jgi:hypothetical protein